MLGEFCIDAIGVLAIERALVLPQVYGSVAVCTVGDSMVLGKQSRPLREQALLLRVYGAGAAFTCGSKACPRKGRCSDLAACHGLAVLTGSDLDRLPKPMSEVAGTGESTGQRDFTQR